MKLEELFVKLEVADSRRKKGDDAPVLCRRTV